MLNKLHELSKTRPNLPNLLSAASILAAAMAISFLYRCIAGEQPAHILLIFVFFLILMFYRTPGYLYGMVYSFLAVLWMCHLTSSPLGAHLFTFAGMSAVALLADAITLHLSVRSGQVSETEKQNTQSDTENMRTNLLRAISHDLRTPLAGILGNTLVYLENQKTLDETEKKNIVASIHMDSSWLINLVENLLAVTRIKNDLVSINTKEELVEEVLSEALQKVEKRHPGCVIRVKIPDDFIMLPMDAMLIEQVTINLLENAILHSGSSTPVDIVVEDVREYISFTVRDYGSGIPENMLENLFRGAAYSSPAFDAGKGAGIGLAICKTIITAHHGTIRGRNHGYGAEFVFTLPKGSQEGLS